MRGMLLSSAALAALAAVPLRAQQWHELQGRSENGVVALRQALLDSGRDTLALLVASHPDDRYVLPAVQLRYLHGVRVAVLLATRGGGGQNSLGPETGDVLERIRTLEAEAGCRQFDGEVYYLDRPDSGYVRTAAETFDEWGREETRAELVRLLRSIRPDVVITTHHAEEQHGHDLALVELLPEAFDLAGDEAFSNGLPPHRPRALFLGATSSPGPVTVEVPSDQFEPLRGRSLGRLAHDIMLRHHLSPGAPAPLETTFGRGLSFVPLRSSAAAPRSLHDGLPDLFDDGIWPGSAGERTELQQLWAEMQAVAMDARQLFQRAKQLVARLDALHCSPGSEAAMRRDRRREALLRVLLSSCGIQIEVESWPGAVAVPGEEIDLLVVLHVGGPLPVTRVEVASPEGEVELEPLDAADASITAGGALRAIASYRVPLSANGAADLMASRFRGDRFVPPVRLEFAVIVDGVTLPVRIDLPVDLRPAVELRVLPRMLLLPATRSEVQFTVEVVRNSAFPVEDRIEVKAPAGYHVDGLRTQVVLREVRGDFFEFRLRAPADRRSRVDVVRIAVGESRIVLPVHMVELRIDPMLRIGVVRSRDDALVSVLGIGGFGLHWAELSDIDLAIRSLDEFDTIVVDVRALRDRPATHRSFRRLLDFCSRPGKRLVVLYHKDVEFDPPGESFLGAPFAPFQIGRARVTRADAPVTLLRPGHPLWNLPNPIRPADWDGWEQERGLYFPSVYSDRYEELVQLNDPGLPPERSAVLYTRCGEGEYIYCALALWRQWKKLHPGSVRMLANLLTPQRQR